MQRAQETSRAKAYLLTAGAKSPRGSLRMFQPEAVERVMRRGLGVSGVHIDRNAKIQGDLAGVALPGPALPAKARQGAQLMHGKARIPVGHDLPPQQQTVEAGGHLFAVKGGARGAKAKREDPPADVPCFWSQGCSSSIRTKECQRVYIIC